MQIVGPRTFTLGASTSIADPAANSGNPSRACQIQNSSSYQILVNAGGAALSIQPFWAQTVEISGQPITIQPETATGTGTCSITLVFLLGSAPNTGPQLPDGTWIETPPQSDGSLTASAIAAAITGSVSIAGVADVLGNISGVTITDLGTTEVFSNLLRSYQTILVQIIGPVGQVSATIANATDSIEFVTGPHDTASANPQPLTGIALGQTSWYFPFANKVGDQLNVRLTSLPAGSLVGCEVIVIGFTGAMATYVLPSIGLPLSTYQVGGTSLATKSVGAGATTPILGAPPAGFAYRLHRITYSFAGAATGAILLGTTSAFYYDFYGSGAPNTNHLDGQMAEEGLSIVNLSGAVVVNTFLSYDLIPVPTLQ